MANRSPSKNIYNIESDGIVGLEQAGDFLGAGISGLEVRLPVLRRQLLGHVLSLEIEEDEAAEEEGETRAEADHDRSVELRFDAWSARNGGGFPR